MGIPLENPSKLSGGQLELQKEPQISGGSLKICKKECRDYITGHVFQAENGGECCREACRVKKYRKNPVSRWQKVAGAVILYNLIICGGVSAVASNEFPDDGGFSGVRVRVRPEDAQRQQELDALRREAAEAAKSLARLEQENRSLREAGQRSQRELIEITNKYQKQNEQYRQLRLVLSGALASGQVRSAGEREEQLLRAMNDTAESGRALALKTVEFCELVEAQTGDQPLGKVKQAEIRLRADELKSESRRFIALTAAEKDEQSLEKCRILAVDRELSVVVLPVGTVHGAFNGLMYYVGKDEAALRVVSVRPFVAAAQLVSGNIDAIAPGMEAVTQSK